MNTDSYDSQLEAGTITVAVTATFTAEPLEQSLAFWMQELGIPARIEFAPYNQVFQQLLDPSSLLSTNHTGVNVILVRLEDWQGESQLDARQEIERNVRDLLRALTAAAERPSTSYLLCLCPSSPSQVADPERVSSFKRMEELIVSELAQVHGIYVLTSSELTATYPVEEYDDPHADKLAHIPFTQVFFTALGTLIARKIYALRSAPYKVIVLDCDQTLWDGVCGEDGPLGIQIDPVREALQQFMVQQHDAGMLLCLCSKNNEEDVAEVFRLRSDMILKREHIVTWRLNWEAKSENIRSLAKELQLGLDSFIFIDDDPVERAEVQANCPQVLSLELPREADTIPRFLKHVWAFDRLKTTEEDSKRTAFYRQNEERERFRKESFTFGDFLAGLGLKLQISPLSGHQLARVSELTQRTNQFNLTTIRRSEAELQRLCQSGKTECLVVQVKDRFGDYGLVGTIIVQADSDAIAVDTFLLSCRAMGRGVEHRMLAHLGEIAKERGLKRVVLPLVPTQKNRPAQDFLGDVGTAFKEPSQDGFLFRFPAEFAANLRYSPPVADGSSAFPSEPSSSAIAPLTSAADTQAKAALLNSIATELQEAEEIHKVISAQTQLRPGTKTTFMAPYGQLEKKVAEVWSEVLGFEQVGRNDDFFALGGHSLLAMRVLSRIRQAFQIELSPGLLFTSEFTVAGLAKMVLKEQIRQAGPEEIAALLSTVEKLSDGEVKALLVDLHYPTQDAKLR